MKSDPGATLPVERAQTSGRYFNRDESWMLFNQRVLEEAGDETNPLLERVKFLAITSSNLDEFVEIRIAGTLQAMEEDLNSAKIADEGGFTQEQRLQRLSEMLHSFALHQDRTWRRQLVPALDHAGIRIVRWKSLDEAERHFATRFFHEQIDPLLTPVTLDPSHPFPRVLNKSLCIALLLRLKRKIPGARRPRSLGVITVPRSLPNMLAMPVRGTQHRFILLEELIEAHADSMFRGYEVMGRAAFRVTRNSNLYLEEEESRSVLERVASELHNRRKGDAVRMEIDASAADDIAERLRTNFELEPWQVFRTESPVNLTRLMDLYSALKVDDLKFPEFHGRRPHLRSGLKDIFDQLREHDILLHHPYDSYNTVEAFSNAGSTDARVVSIKQTLYRTSADSPIFRALTEAAESKNVTVVVELMARFDEASNIRWARELEDAGVQVFHGLFGLKTHCKLALVVRQDPDGVTRSYAHLGTGNYNPVTARFYTDISLLTADPAITGAVQNVFRYLTADWKAPGEAYRPLLVAPLTLASDLVALIGREAAYARAGRPAHVIAKMNALLDAPLIDALYEASQAGVEVDLIIRGMCALRPGVKGLSERIRVRSVVGRFLEHSRIFYFANGGEDECYAGSADWMPRNLYERCEVVFPVNDPLLRHRLRTEILEAYLRDNVKGRVLQSDGVYTRPPASPGLLSAQEWLMRRSAEPVAAAPKSAAPEPPAAQLKTPVLPGPSAAATKSERTAPAAASCSEDGRGKGGSAKDKPVAGKQKRRAK